MKYYLVDNPLTVEPGDCMARVETVSTITREKLIELCCDQNAGFNHSMVTGLFDRLEKVVVKAAADGKTIVTPLGSISASISGVFDNAADSFDPDRHELKFNIRTGHLFSKVAEDIKPVKVNPRQSGINIVSFFDHASGTTNDVLTPGSIGELQGNLLKYDDSDEQQGIFFIDTQQIATKCSVVAHNAGTKLMFAIPSDLTAGIYEVEVRTGLRTKAIVQGRLPAKLTVS
ncbi:MAG: DUF4469 domain-containing protein [Marinilabiliaceae bacterium]|nr:DUF4469 domain-containing protein [Marinilabiliaceae bacterium]